MSFNDFIDRYGDYIPPVIVGTLVSVGLSMVVFVAAHAPPKEEYPIDSITVDGCQYLKYRKSLTHKGSCTNPIHFSNKLETK